MKTIIETLVDKSKWQEGPWQNEPDKKQWLDEATGYPCLIVRQIELGHLCGYVGVPPGHPWFEKEYVDANVHGGLTFARHCGNLICHEVEEGEEDNVWWLGYDAAHGYDRTMLTDLHTECFKDLPSFPHKYDTYRDFAYMEEECRSLAKQAKEAEKDLTAKPL